MLQVAIIVVYQTQDFYHSSIEKKKHSLQIEILENREREKQREKDSEIKRKKEKERKKE